ncbi:MAG TPA: ATP phosphoribosyltransferase [Firmicutes bacterium]|jgi:ATP phosphoribosyltransferase|nr:ATP phosphoribosyltransferase [Bacillota bacterium]
MIKIALPNKGTLSEDAVRLVTEAGYKCRRSSSELIIQDSANGVDFYFLRPRDIAIYIGNGFLDLGITGRDLVLDSEAKVIELLPLNFGHSAFFYAVPQGSKLTPNDFSGKRIATSYPRLVEHDLKSRGITAQIVKLDGAVEISIKLGVADAIADVVQSGKTLGEAGLMKIDQPLLRSEAILIAHSEDTTHKKDVDLFVQRLKGIIVAREYVLAEYDIPKHSLDEACIITPGIESPTISPLSNENWFAVKSMVKKADMNVIIDKLAAIGAKAIIITEIRTCRI